MHCSCLLARLPAGYDGAKKLLRNLLKQSKEGNMTHFFVPNATAGFVWLLGCLTLDESSKASKADGQAQNGMDGWIERRLGSTLQYCTA